MLKLKPSQSYKTNAKNVVLKLEQLKATKHSSPVFHDGDRKRK
jgi:hypothetical protein